MSMKHILTESYRDTQRVSGVDPSKPGNLKALLVNDTAFNTYVESLSESIENVDDRDNFKVLAENTRVSLLENSMYNINPYESLTLPVLRVFYPKLIAKEIVTVSPMDKPESVKAFINANFTPANSTTQYPAPVTGTDISGGPSNGIPVAATIAVPSQAFDILGTMSLTKAQAHLERDFLITAVTDGTHSTAVNISPAVEGHFSFATSVNGHDDVVSGQVDFLNGTVTVASATGFVKDLKYSVSCSLEENQVNPKVQLSIDKIRLYAKDRTISADWTINMEQDMRALFDVSMQAEVVNLLGQQIALDIDREIVTSLFSANANLNTAAHTTSFTRTPPAGYSWGPAYWHTNVVERLNILSASVYNDTNIHAANTIFANPLDAAILEDINGFSYNGTSDTNGDMGYRTATLAGGKWKVLVSSVVTAGSMGVVYKPANEIESIYFYSPYVPAILHPYPLGYKPTLTILSRYATALVRHNGVAALTVGA